MGNKKCLNCGGTDFAEGTDFLPIKPSKMSMSNKNKIYIFCLDCGEVDSICIENTIIPRKNRGNSINVLHKDLGKHYR